MPVIFGNILTETEDRQGGGSKGEKKTRPEYDPVYLQQHFNHLLGTNLVTCPFANYSLLIRCSPIKETHPEARFCDSVADSLVTHTHTHTPPHPTTSTSIVQMLPSVYKTLALSPLWFCFKTLTANHFLWPESSINSCYLPIEESTVRQQGNTFLAHLLQCRFCKAAEL